MSFYPWQIFLSRQEMMIWDYVSTCFDQGSKNPKLLTVWNEWPIILNWVSSSSPKNRRAWQVEYRRWQCITRNMKISSKFHFSKLFVPCNNIFQRMHLMYLCDVIFITLIGTFTFILGILIIQNELEYFSINECLRCR